MRATASMRGMTSIADSTGNGVPTVASVPTITRKIAMKTNINENRRSSASQKDKILEYLMSGKSLTPIEALNMFGSFRLGARIADIKADGYIVYTEMITDPVTGKRYARYSM